jgi:YHS domain-containing protein
VAPDAAKLFERSWFANLSRDPSTPLSSKGSGQMKRVVLFVLFLLISTTAAAATFINTTGSDDSVAIAGYDPVAFFTEQKAVRGKPEYVYTHLEAKWLFATQENLKTFQDNPGKYLPEWGGQCAWCVAENCVSQKKISGDFAVVDGKLYLFSFGNSARDGAKSDFLYGRYSTANRIRDGDMNWAEIKKKLEEGRIVQPNSTNYKKTRFD